MKKVDSNGSVSRRGLLRAGLSALAAGLLLKFVGANSVAVDRVQGANGQTIIIGQGNTGSSTTTLSSPVSGGPDAFFDNAGGTGDAQAIQGRITGTSGRAFVGFASATSGGTIALDGVCNSPSGIGLRGANTATTGNAIGVQGQTGSTTGSLFLGKLGDVEKFRVSGDGTVGQTVSASGLVKAAVIVRGDTPAVLRSFNNLPGGTTPTVSKVSGPGTYQVNFGVDVTQRYFAATLLASNMTDLGGSSDGQILASKRDGTSNAVFIRTNDSTGNNTDRSFYLLLY